MYGPTRKSNQTTHFWVISESLWKAAERWWGVWSFIFLLLPETHILPQQSNLHRANVDDEGRDLIVYLSLSSLFCSENYSVNGQHLWKENPEILDYFGGEIRNSCLGIRVIIWQGHGIFLGGVFQSNDLTRRSDERANVCEEFKVLIGFALLKNTLLGNKLNEKICFLLKVR